MSRLGLRMAQTRGGKEISDRLYRPQAHDPSWLKVRMHVCPGFIERLRLLITSNTLYLIMNTIDEAHTPYMLREITSTIHSSTVSRYVESMLYSHGYNSHRKPIPSYQR